MITFTPAVIGWVLPPGLLIGIALLLVHRRRINREPNLIKRGFLLFRLNLLSFGIYAVFLGLLLFPLSLLLSRSGYPDNVESIQSAEQLREYLHIYNQALVTALNVLTFFFYFFGIWLLSAIYAFARLVKDALLARPPQQVSLAPPSHD